MHNTTIASGTTSLLLRAGLLVAVASTVLPGRASAADTDSIRFLHLDQIAHREAAWAQLFPEAPALTSSILYLGAVLDDATPWSYDVQVVGAFDGATMAFGGLHLTEESSAMPLAIASPVESGGELPSQTGGAAEATFMSGVLIGDSGVQLAVFGVRLSIEVSELALIAPVHVDVFVPLTFPESSRVADHVVYEAQATLFPPVDEDPEVDAEAAKQFASALLETASSGSPDLAKASQKAGQSPGNLSTVDTNPGHPSATDPAQDETPGCVGAAWAVLGYDLAAAWTEAAILEGSCFDECILDANSGDDAQTRVRHCLPGCGLGFLASGEGTITWAWSAFGMASAECDAAPGASSRSSRSAR